MKITRLAVISLTAVLAFGCRYSSPSDDNDDGGSTQPPAETYPIEGVNWEITTVAKAAILPDVYFFESSLLTIYSDDNNDGTYTYSTTGYTATSTTIKFDDIDGTYTVDADGALTIIYTEDGVEMYVNGITVTDPETLSAIDSAEPGDDIVNQIVRILDTKTTDAGELRLKLSEQDIAPITSGKLTVNLAYQVDADSGEEENDNGNNAYISLYASGTSNINLHGEVVFNDGEIFYRTNVLDEKGKPTLSDAIGTFELGEDLAVQVTWESNTYSFTVNDTPYGPFTGPEGLPVEVVALKLGDTSNTSHFELIADNLTIYSNDTTADSVVFEDDFDRYAVGFGLVPPYNSSTNEATVMVDGDDSGTEPDPTCEDLGQTGEYPDCMPIEGDNSQMVKILDTLSDDTGELRIKIADATEVESIISGTMTVSIQHQIDTDSTATPSDENAVYVSLYSDGTSSTNIHGEIIFSGEKIKYRDSTGSQQTIDGATYSYGDILDVEVTWDATTYSFAVDGTSYGPYDSRDVTPVKVIALRLGSNDDTTIYELNADDLIIYSNDVAADTEVFSDDFESYMVGDSLNPEDENAATDTPYNKSTSEATVVGDAEEPTDPNTVTDDFESYTVETQIDTANSAYKVDGVDGTTVIAQVSDTLANSGSNSLYLFDNNGDGVTGEKPVVTRAFKNGAATTGSVSVSVYIPAEGYNKSSYVYLGTSESASSSARFTEIAFGSSEIKFRAADTKQYAIHDYAQDTWVDVTISWDGTAVTIEVDGMEYTTYDVEGVATDMIAENDTGAPTLFAVYNGDSKTVGTYTYFDDIDSSLF